GVTIVKVLLHVGLGTFRPVEVEDIREHRMHSEYFEVSDEAARKINEVKKNGGRIIAIGTTAARTLESSVAESSVSESSGADSQSASEALPPGGLRVRPTAEFVTAQRGNTSIFIYPPYKFKIV